jgi:hypothetical protein
MVNWGSIWESQGDITKDIVDYYKNLYTKSEIRRPGALIFGYWKWRM